MSQAKFGGPHTELKLDKLEAYLNAFTTALKRQNFRRIYFDAFAGTGDIPRDELPPSILGADDYQPFISGSARRALAVKEKFDEYIFVESSSKKVAELNRLRDEHPALNAKINIKRGNANIELQEFCSLRNWRSTRAVVFLDPYGNQVTWQTVEAVASTEAIDFWCLFPAGLGVHRQIGRDGTVDASHEASLDQLFGTGEWRKAFVQTTEKADLFGSQLVPTKVATPESITLYMIQRMKTVFRGGVLDEWLPLGSNGVHMYSLLFAWANPSEKAKLAGKLASVVLRSKSRGRAK
jgi:three-Cys-motif partner protein